MRTRSSRFASDKCKAQKVQSETHDGCEKGVRLPKFDDLADQFLRQADDDEVLGRAGLEAARIEIVSLFGRARRLLEKIDEAFGGAPFLPNFSATHPVNRLRFNTFCKEHQKAARLLGYSLELWILAWLPDRSAVASRMSAHRILSQGLARKTNRAGAGQTDIGGSGNAPANKNGLPGDATRTQALPKKGCQTSLFTKQSH